MDPDLVRIYEDDDLLVVNKPSGLVCHPSKSGPHSSLVGRVRSYLNSTPHLINRLDRETSGVVLVAKQASVAGELGRLWEDRRVTKDYVALVRGWVGDDRGQIDAPLGRDEQSVVAIKDCVRADGAPAVTEFEVRQRFERAEGKFSRLHVRPLSGRKHQIRIHLAHLGYPIVGDKIYGDDEQLYLAFVQGTLTPEQAGRLILPNHALHAESVSLLWRESPVKFSAAPEPWFLEFAGLPNSI